VISSLLTSTTSGRGPFLAYSGPTPTKVTALLNSLPGYGSAKVIVLMQRTGIAPFRRITGLSERGIGSWGPGEAPAAQRGRTAWRPTSMTRY
jgi:hypothetical protein